ncbi:CoA transferase [uncultured Williamsia sp.]|uniref:CaiB/BaiF CoA transferase family protein n=1 Tax=uncultured Williamsia sp. TaxID=259311 RepID=UPI00261BAD15|nr:CoA transferase [uncultured Williamsia sp.]
MTRSLVGLRVVEIASDIAAPYGCRLLRSLGADVVKIETGSGDVLRQRVSAADTAVATRHGGLFDYVNADKRGLTVDPDDARDRSVVRDLIADCDVLIESLPPGGTEQARWGVDHASLEGLGNPLVVLRVSDFGQTGPRVGVPTSPLTMQAATGWVTERDPGRTPVGAGGRIPEYVAGAWVAVATLSALPIAARDGVVEVDLAVAEAMMSTLPYPMLVAQRLMSMGLPPTSSTQPMVGVLAAADGWVGINCLTGQNWLDVCAMVGGIEFGEHQMSIMIGGPERAQFFALIEPWVAERKVEDIVALCQAMRIPATPVCDGRTVLSCPQFEQRGFFVETELDGRGYTRPGPAFRLSATPADPTGSAPSLGAADTTWLDTERFRADATTDPARPLAGLRVFDLSTFWAGAYVTCYLGALGADVVKVESIQRPDSHRYSGGMLYQGDDAYERGALWQGTNLNKRDITLNLNSTEGREIALRMAGEADVVIENFSARVVEQFGLDYESLRAINPDVIEVRMPGFGLEGPWRDWVGWALNFEQLSGMTWATGYPDGNPCNLQGPADPIAGVHACVALLAAVAHRARTGEGQLVEVAQIEAGAAANPEQVIEYSLTGNVPSRMGNRDTVAAQGVYPTSEEGRFVALTVRDDDDWAAITPIVGPDATAARTLASAADRRAHHDLFDDVVGKWCSARTGPEIVDTLRAAGVPVTEVMTADRMYDDEQLRHRGYFQEISHPLSGELEFPGWPFRMSPGPDHHHRAPAPTLGQHNDEVLHEVGLGDAQIADLRETQVIGDKLLARR